MYASVHGGVGGEGSPGGRGGGWAAVSWIWTWTRDYAPITEPAAGLSRGAPAVGTLCGQSASLKGGNVFVSVCGLAGCECHVHAHTYACMCVTCVLAHGHGSRRALDKGCCYFAWHLILSHLERSE